MECRICNTTLKRFLDLGRQPIANNFLADGYLTDEFFYRLEVFFCPECYTVQIGDCPAKEDIFNKEYAFFTSTSEYMKQHFEMMADDIKERFLPKEGFIVEIGSNDGTFLNNFMGFVHLGIEPSKNVFDYAIGEKVNCWNKFFNEQVAEEIVEWYGKADVIVTTNCFPHMVDRNSVLRGIKKLLRPEGIWINEEAYLGSIFSITSYDQFYNEHVFFSSIASFRKSMNMYDLNLQTIEQTPVHGGSIIFYTTHMGWNTSNFGLDYFESRENLNEFDRFQKFAKQAKQKREDLLKKILPLKGDVVGYGATAKSTTILNYCKIGDNLISRIYDTTPIKQGKLSPGMHIPIVPYSEFERDNPKNVVLFAWNHMEEIMEKEKDKDINWILPI